MIILKGVSKSYGKTAVLSDITVRIDPQELVCITGKSGAGKSTLLHLLTGAEAATKGIVEVDGVDLRVVPATVLQLYRRRVGIVFQDYKLIAHRTVAENIALPLEICGLHDLAIERRVTEILKELDLGKCARSLPSTLSGGERARIAIGRAIAGKPMILLADEPTGNLDHEASLAILKLFVEIHKRGTTVIVATHDAELLEGLRARQIHLENGRIAKDTSGTNPATVDASADEKVSAHKKKVRVVGLAT